MDKRRESSQTRRIRRTKVDWFGIIMMFVLLVCSLAIFARLMATKMLTTTNLVLVMAALLVVNGLHIFVQLPLRRNKLGKLICGVLAVLLSAGMIYGTVAAGAVQSALNKISGVMVEKQVTAVIVMKEDEATDLGDTKGYRFGILANRDTNNTQQILSAMEKSMGKVETASYDTPAEMADALYDDEVQALILNEGYIPLLTCSPSLNEPPSAIIRQPNTSYLSVTIKRKLTPVVRPASTENFCFCVLITFSVIGSKRIKLTVPEIFFPVRFATEAVTEVLSPTRTKRGKFGVSIKSLLVTAVASIIPVIIPLVCAYPRKFQRVRLCGMVKKKETSPCSLVRSCG